MFLMYICMHGHLCMYRYVHVCSSMYRSQRITLDINLKYPVYLLGDGVSFWPRDHQLG